MSARDPLGDTESCYLLTTYVIQVSAGNIFPQKISEMPHAPQVTFAPANPLYVAVNVMFPSALDQLRHCRGGDAPFAQREPDCARTAAAEASRAASRRMMVWRGFPAIRKV